MTNTPDFTQGVDDVPSGDLSSLFPGIDKTTATMNVLLKRGQPAGVGIAGTVVPAIGVVAQYMNPDQAPVLDVLSGFYQLNNENLTGLQQRLYAGGFYSSSFYNKNSPNAVTQVHDDDTLSAYTRAVKKAARSGMTVDEAINEGLTGGSGGAGGKGRGGGGPTRAPLTISLTNPTDLQFVANKAGQALLGRNLNDKEIAAFTQAFHGQETTAQRQAYNSAVGGGTSVQAPNAQTAAEAQIRANAPVEAGAHDVAGTFDAFLSLIGGTK